MDILDIECLPVVKGIPESHWDCAFDNFDFAECQFLKSMTQLFLDNEPMWLYIHGQPGRGKTHYAVALHRALVALHKFEGAESSIFVEFKRMMDELKASIDNFTVDERLAGYLDSETLILDDVTGSLTDFETRMLEDIIKRRHASQDRLIITSNEEESRFISMFGEHEVSRFQELTYIVKLGGLDKRTS